MRFDNTNFAALIAAIIIITIVVIATLTARGDEPTPTTTLDPLNRELLAASKDSAAIAHSKGSSSHTVYLTMYDDEDPDMTYAVVSGLLNHISYAGYIYRPDRVSETLIRIDQLRVAPKKEQLTLWSAAQNDFAIVDPFFHSAETLTIQASDGNFYPVDSIISRSPHIVATYRGKTYTSNGTSTKFKVISAGDPPWLDPRELHLLKTTTGSKAPILHARWWVAKACESPRYYRFIGAPATYEEWVVQAGLKGVRGFGNGGLGANLDRSQVTDKLRQFERRDSLWSTFDAELQDKAHDPFELPDGNQRFDAIESFYMGENNTWRFSIWNGQLARQDFVPPQIAIDDSYGKVRTLTPPLSCISCHCKTLADGETAGILGWEDRQSLLVLKTDDAALAEKRESYYGNQPRLHREAGRDREDYAEAIHLACGLTPAEFAANLNRIVDSVTREPVDAERACLALGIDLPDYVAPTEALKKWVGLSKNPALIDLCEGRTVQYQRFERALGEAFVLISNTRRYRTSP